MRRDALETVEFSPEELDRSLAQDSEQAMKLVTDLNLPKDYRIPRNPKELR